MAYGRIVRRCNSCGHVLVAGSSFPHQAGIETIESRVSPVSAEWLLTQLPQEVSGHSHLRYLDVGCWDGTLMSRLPTTWIGKGIEPSGPAASRARSRGLDVVQGFVEDVFIEPAAFDLVLLIDVIEHIPQPRPVLEKLSSALRPNGVLVALTGNAASDAARIFGARWYYLHYPEHCSVFTPTSLRIVLEDAGLRLRTMCTLAHPVANAWRDLTQACVHPFRRSLAHETGDTSLSGAVGLNVMSLSRLARRRDHLLAIASPIA